MIHASKWKPAPFYVLDLEREVRERGGIVPDAVSYTHLRDHETDS